jgi:hypothetical protein
MKSLIQAVIIGVVHVGSAVPFARQSNAPRVRIQMRIELVQLEKTGYRPAQ